MMRDLLIKIILFFTFDCLLVSLADNTSSGKIYHLGKITYDKCEGKEIGNFTSMIYGTSDLTCSSQSEVLKFDIIQFDSNGKTSINHLEPLALAFFPGAGEIVRLDGLFLATSGRLQGKFIYQRIDHNYFNYLKLCSSVLGLNYFTSKIAELMISDSLDINVLLSPNGVYEAFKKSSWTTTFCSGIDIVV